MHQPSANELGIWILCFICLVNGGAAVAAIVAVFRTQRRSVKMEENFATVSAVKEVESDLCALKDSIVKNGDLRKAAIEGKLEAVRQEVKGDISDLSDKIISVAVQVGGLEKETALFNQRLIQIGDKLDRTAERRAAVAV